MKRCKHPAEQRRRRANGRTDCPLCRAEWNQTSRLREQGRYGVFNLNWPRPGAV